jgi:hypothetical protein
VNLYEERFLVRQFSREGGVVLDLTGSSATGALAAAVEGRNAIYVDGETARIYDAFCRTEAFFATEMSKLEALGLQYEAEDEAPAGDPTPYAAGAVREKETPCDEDVAAQYKKVEGYISWISSKDDIPDLDAIVKFWLSTMKLGAFRTLMRASEGKGNRML